MATRSRTLLFLNFRNSFARNNSQFRATTQGPSGGRDFYDTSEHAGLIANQGHAGEVAVELSVLPPRWVDIVDEIEEDIGSLQHKITSLESAYKKHVLPGFDDRIGDEQSIERLTDDVTRTFQMIQHKIKRVHMESRNTDQRQTKSLSKNIQTSLATKLQELSSSFRKTQSTYLRKLRGREAATNPTKYGAVESPDEEDLDAVFTDAQLATVINNERAISEREREINEIAKSILGLAEVFKDLNTMVIDQGTVLDRIDYNVEQTNIALEDAHKELVKASTYQSTTPAKYCIAVLLVMVVIMIFVLWWKIAHRR
ncbi:t-SNARE [Entophlyctis helioformis]|nr:t-SNARE [Entophlyctis helioformis]